jgi:hypothetical protein
MAQSTDNDGPMIVCAEGEVLPEGDPRRRPVIDDISRTLGRGVSTIISDEVSIYEHNGLIAFKVVPQLRDEADRLAPLVGVTSRSVVGEAGWPEGAVEEFIWFGRQAGRPLDDDLGRHLLSGIQHAKKKRTTSFKPKSTALVVGLLLAGVATTIFLWWTLH